MTAALILTAGIQIRYSNGQSVPAFLLLLATCLGASEYWVTVSGNILEKEEQKWVHVPKVNRLRQ